MEKSRRIRDRPSSAPFLDTKLNKELEDILDSPDIGGTTDSEPSIFANDNSNDPDYIPSTEAFQSVEQAPPSSELLQPRSVLNTQNPSRKRQRNTSDWTRETVKRKRQQGKAYETSSGKLMPAKQLKEVKCGKDCSKNCPQYFPTERRKEIHDHFWTLNDEEKKLFYTQFVVRCEIKRRRVSSKSFKKQNTFKYSLESNNQVYQVCQSFFLATLCISQRVVYYFYEKNYNQSTGVPIKSNKGKHIKHKLQSRIAIRTHIESFPVVDPHYSRAGSQRQYLETGLSIRKMYDLFKQNNDAEVKYDSYRRIFNTEYNLSFFVPKKDQCDTCLKFKNQIDPSQTEKETYENHRKYNEDAKRQKEIDKTLHSNEVAVVCYDLQNVFQLPHGFAGNFYYKRKFATYNLTGHCNINKVTYCALWYETQSGRSGNDIASALLKILKSIKNDNTQIKHIILWSDSCIPQNKNRITSLALLKFLEENPGIISITHRYSEAGHSRIQEVDAVHSVIDRHLKHISYHSPISLLRNLKNMNYEKVKLKIIQLSPSDIFNFNAASLSLNFGNIKYKSTREIKYSNDDLLHVQYKKNFGEFADIMKIPVFRPNSIRSKTKDRTRSTLPIVQKCKAATTVSKEKVNDIISMMPFMPIEDVDFYKAVFC